MTRELTPKGSTMTHAAVIVAVVIAAATGAIAWGQTQEKVGTLEKQQERYELKQHSMQIQQQRNSATLERLDERSKRESVQQQRILDAVQRLDERLDNVR